LLVIIALFCAILIITLLGVSQLLTLNSEWQHTLNYFLILTPYLIFIALISLLSSILNVLGHFFSTAISPIIFNIAWIISLIIAWQFFQVNNDRLILICFFLTFSGVFQVGLLLITLQKLNWKIKFSLPKEILPTKKLLKKILIVLFCFAVFQINLLVDGVLCLFLAKSDHALAALYYSDRIQQLPIAIITISIATASFPLLSSFYSQGKTQEFRNTLTKSLRGVWYLTLPCCIGIFFLAEPLSQQLYSFKDSTSTFETTSTLICFTISLLFTCTTPILTRVFYTIGEIKTPLIIGLIVICCNIVFGIAFFFITHLDGAAIALGTSVSSILHAGT
jgi:putative peptidoglycan lipid II flippase